MPRLALLIVLLLVAPGALLAGCGLPQTGQGGFVEQVADDPDLTLDTRDLGGGTPKDTADLHRLVLRIRDSVRDLSTLDAAAYAARWHRSPADQANLVGRWLGRSAQVTHGKQAARELRRATRGVVPARKGASARQVLAALAARLVALAPNEASDNPDLPGAENLRSAMQSAFATARG